MRIFGLDIQRPKELRGAERAMATENRVQRLEIDLAHLVEKFEALAAAHAKLRSIVHGDRSARPQSQNVRPTLDTIPFGDKRQLRIALGIVPASRQRPEDNQNGE